MILRVFPLTNLFPEVALSRIGRHAPALQEATRAKEESADGKVIYMLICFDFLKEP